LRLPGIDVHSYEQNAVNLPGLFCSLAIWTLSFHTVAVIFGSMNAFTGAPEPSLSRYEKIRFCSSWLVSFMIIGCAAGSVLT
jgi:hypothetical protein